ncbi:MAG: chromate efflux transporter [Armatimonadaceae bacterium]
MSDPSPSASVAAPLNEESAPAPIPGAEPAPEPIPKNTDRELFLLFTRLGFTAFGGPAAHIAMLKDEVVDRRKWLTEAEFLDLLGATNLIPGPNSTEMAIHVGYLRGGMRGLVIAGLCFILPAAFIVSVCAWAYQQYGTLPQAEGILYGVKPVIIAVVVQAIWGLAKPALKSPLLIALAVAALALALLGIPELALLFGAGAVAGVGRWFARRTVAPDSEEKGAGAVADTASAASGGNARSLLTLLIIAAALVIVPSLLTVFFTQNVGADGLPFGLTPLFLFFLKIGSVLYGSGYVLLAFLRDGLVSDWRWLTEGQLLDAVAVGQVTPGPVFTTATFIGYFLGGPAGAAVATVGIFLPAFVFVALSGQIVPRIRRSPLAGAFLDGVNVAAFALMVAVTLELGRTALVDIPTIALALTSAVLLVRFKVNSVWLLAAGALLGTILSATGLR